MECVVLQYSAFVKKWPSSGHVSTSTFKELLLDNKHCYQKAAYAVKRFNLQVALVRQLGAGLDGSRH